jgi:hypothetical protein
VRGAAPLAAGLALWAAAAWAGPGVPGAEWFRGVYERVGRDAAGLLDDRVHLVPEGGNLLLTACGVPDTPLGFDPYGLRENGMVSGTGTAALSCLFHNDGFNRPVITCRSEEGTRFTLWPVEPGFRTAALDCGD